MNELKPKKGTKVKMVAKGIFQGEEEDMTKPPKWFINFEIKINKRLDNIEKDITAIKNTPTMKKELKLI